MKTAHYHSIVGLIMINLKLIILLFIAFVFDSCKFTGNLSPYAHVMMIDSSMSREKIMDRATHVIPTKRQMAWQLKELSAFIHFGMNTFTNVEWGTGQEHPNTFAPKSLDVDQWVNVIKESGFKQVILTAKHHDGFCLWPSAYTHYSIKYSSWENGNGDVVKEIADACVRHKIDLGIYISPWDRHEVTYGTDAYNSFFKNQLRELLTNYGDITEVWFDGAVGEGPNGKKQIYDWSGFYNIVRELQPQATIAVKGPDIRWVGTETGYGRDTEWSTVPIYDTNLYSTYAPEDNILMPQINETNEDFGSLTQLIDAKAIKWYPSEVDVSLRPGWFYHREEDNEVKSPEELIDIYFNSIGKNSGLLINISPDPTGSIPEKDATILKVFYNSIRSIFDENIAREATITGSEFNLQHRAKSAVDGKYKTYWNPDNSVAPYLLFEWDKPIWFNVLLLAEQISFGQRVSSFQLEVYENDSWVTKVTGTTIGYKRLVRFPFIKTTKARLIFSECRANPFIAEVGFFQDMPQVQIDPSSQPFEDSIWISMNTNNPDTKIYFSQNFTTPSPATNLYTSPIKLNASSPVLAIAYAPDQTSGFIRNEFYAKSKYNVTLHTTPDAEYLHEGGIILCDRIKGDENIKSKKWLGFDHQDLEVTFDLKERTKVRSIHITGLVDTSKMIYPPSSIKMYSANSQKSKFNLVLDKTPLVDYSKKMQTFRFTNLDLQTQYLRFSISSSKQDRSNSNWLFVSEIELD